MDSFRYTTAISRGHTPARYSIQSHRQTSFYYVYAPSQGAPTVQHPTEELAVAEAKRLAAKHPGEKFYVLEARGFAMRSESLYTPLHGEIPF